MLSNKRTKKRAKEERKEGIYTVFFNLFVLSFNLK